MLSGMPTPGSTGKLPSGTEVLPEKCSIAGWSLGGLLAQKYLERFPQRVQSLMLIASTPKFIASADWPHAMPEKTFKNFLNQFKLIRTITKLLPKDEKLYR